MKKLNEIIKNAGKHVARLGIVAGICTSLFLSSCKNPFFMLERENQNQYTMAFALVGRNESENNQENIATIQELKDEFPSKFSYATNEMAEMDTSSEIIFLADKTEYDNESLEIYELSKKVISELGDKFDFISFFPTFTTITKIGEGFVDSYHISAQNKLSGIGKKLFDNTQYYGSNGKLLGVNVFPFLSYDYTKDYNQESLKVSRLNRMLHETGHQWGVFIGDNFSRDKTKDLEMKLDDIHFYPGLESSYEHTTPMNSAAWIKNSDGKTFHVEDSYHHPEMNIIKKYHPFMLYFMGLYTKDNYNFDKKFRVFDCGLIDEGKGYREANFKNVSLYKKVSINDIINVEGERAYNNF